MPAKVTGIDLLKRNFINVENKFLDFFKKGQPRWPSEEHDHLRNHHKSLENFFTTNISFEKLAIVDLPDNIKHETLMAYEAFQRGEEYNG